MNQIEAARIIRDQGGECCEPISIHCIYDNCPAREERIKKEFISCSLLWGSGNSLKEQWFNNWLAENDKENVMSEKIQHTEGEWRKIIRVIHGDCQEDDHDEEHYLNNLKKSGYIVKSELQQKVEEVEDYYRIFKQKDYNMDCEYAFMRDALISHNQLIQLLKKDHPEFKE